MPRSPTPSRGPIVTFVAALREAGILADADLARLEAAVERELAAAVAFAEACTFEEVTDLTRDVYTREAAAR